MQEQYFIGVDVGTGSVRAGLFDHKGRIRGVGHHPIQTWRPQPDFVEQSSGDIWQACSAAVCQAVREAGVSPENVAGIGFDATCSLVVLDATGNPVTVSPTGEDTQNVIVWMDHRAVEQAERINAMGHAVLAYVGGTISPEMQTPKLLWLKENLPKSWSRAARFLDLPDFLTFRATGYDTRSLCTTVCKWTYLGHESGDRNDSVGRWDPSYWTRIGLGDIVDEKFARVGQRVRPLGEAVGEGLTPQAAEELGLLSGTPVAVSIIDAHAGGLGTLGARLEPRPATPEEMMRSLALIAGTSSCHMALSPEPAFVPGVWGPYFSAMVPGMWLTEGGQSASGALIDHIIFSHARARDLEAAAEAGGATVYILLNDRLDVLAQGVEHPAALTSDLHVLPYFHGNRSPRADPTLRGGISGLRLSDTLDELARLYLATIQALAHGTKHIIDTMNVHGYRIDTIHATGGGTKNPVFLREHADVTGCQIILPEEPEAVLLGAAILGAVAASAYSSIPAAMVSMNRIGQVIEPNGAVRKYHDAKHAVFQRMYTDQIAYRNIMAR